MVEDNQEKNEESLGQFLKRHRKEQKIDKKIVIAETRIPGKTFDAIEADEYEGLPAEAFARGFYTLYAKFLGLDTQEVLERYSFERSKTPETPDRPPPIKQVQSVNTMAARPPVAIASAFGFGLVLLIIFISLICWYFSWNPATFLSGKLRNLQEPAPVETPIETVEEIAVIEAPLATTISPETTYYLTVQFQEDITATYSVDDSFPEKELFYKGSSHSWQAKQALTLILPENAKVSLLLNGSQIELPEPEGGFITFNRP